MYVMSRGAAAKDSVLAAPRLEGRVHHRGELRPREVSGEYRSLIKEREDRANAPRRTMGIVDDEQSLLKKQKLSHRQMRADEAAAKAKKAAQRQKNSQSKAAQPELSSRELKEALKGCFARQPFWSRHDLVRELGNENALGKGLEELCVRVTAKGTQHYGDYRLKDEYRTGLPAAGGGDGASPSFGGASSLPMP